VFIEKFIVDPRHIEIQVLGDKHGNVIHLGERECSIQRRNQKVIEEAPSPLLDEATRARMGAEAVALAKAVNYDSAGTVEFVAGQDRSFFFLEMNTRLQVEHPVTELVTGIDLVEQMIRVAAGEPLRLAQDAVRLNGWAVESRIYAEDPYRNFLPSTGRLTRYRPPPEATQSGITVRNDTGVYEGGEISIYYDPMIAKLCTHAPDRLTAIRAMGDALDGFFIEGIRHNVPFLASIMDNARWRSGALSTGFIREEYPEGFEAIVPDRSLRDTLASVAVVLDHIENQRKRRITGQLGGRAVRFASCRVVALGDEWLPVDIVSESDRLIRIAHRGTGGGERAVETEWSPTDPIFEGRIDGRPVRVQVRRVLNGYRLGHRGADMVARVYTGREAELARLMPERVLSDAARQLLCPMPGLIVSIAVEVGQEVKAGEPLAIVEAMKMENILRAERDGKVKAIHARKGDSLAVDAVIMEFE
jgi:propionyl-CoA carboxylase alpha chain